MKKKTLLIITLIVILALSITLIKTCILGKKPFTDLKAHQIAPAYVRLSPPDKTVQIVEKKELIEYLKDVEIYEKDNSYKEYAGQACIFTITKEGGTVIEVTVFNPFIIINGVGYKCKFESCKKLSSYANRLLNN